LFPGVTEFREGSTVVLQAEWAHARREIAHLQRELLQARSELAEAHAIFDEIHRHPIAGPVVRLRQRMLDRMRAWRGAGKNGAAAATGESTAPHEDAS
jgi:hypothetical protein